MNKFEIIPAIMPRNFEYLKRNLELVRGAAKVVQLDIMDGKFVKNASWPYGEHDVESFEKIMREEEGMPFWDEIDFELDLMILDADKEFEKLVKLAPKRIVFHIEAFPNLKNFLENLDPYYKEHIEFGVAINTTTPIETIFPIIPEVKFVQCMGIEKIGYQGNPFDERVFGHIERLRKEFPDITISVDGAVNMETAPELLDAGADRLVIGSAIFESDDVRETINSFRAL